MKIKILLVVMLAGISFGMNNPKRGSISETFRESKHSGLAKVYDLKYNGNVIGNSFWIDRTGQKIKADYYAAKINGQDVATRYNNLKNNTRNKVFSCSGSMAINGSGVDGTNYRAEGFTYDHGKAVSTEVVKKMYDGLVVIYSGPGANGGIAVSDLTKGDLNVGDRKNLNIRKSNSDKIFVQKWAEEQELTVFQCQLLAYENQLKPMYDDATSSRRLLVAAKDNNTGKLYHIVLYSQSGISLKDFASSLLSYLKNKNMYTYFILNLDTGMFNIQGFFSDNSSNTEQTQYQVGGYTVPSNVLFWYYDN